MEICFKVLETHQHVYEPFLSFNHIYKYTLMPLDARLKETPCIGLASSLF